MFFRKFFPAIIIFLLIILLPGKTYARNRIIAIDPGHGGENQGASFYNNKEKFLNLSVAKAMKEELEKYEGVTVVLTREDDVDLTLEERSGIAKKQKADILISLHFNASENHELHGTEVWVPSDPALYATSSRLARTEILLLEQYGLEKRGVFSRQTEEGDEYYGIIRTASKLNIPSLIIEHCYLDRPEDLQFYDSPEALKNLGIIDATAVAYTYRLKSESLNVDYSKAKGKDLALPVKIELPTTGDDTSSFYYAGVKKETLNAPSVERLSVPSESKFDQKLERVIKTNGDNRSISYSLYGWEKDKLKNPGEKETSSESGKDLNQIDLYEGNENLAEADNDLEEIQDIIMVSSAESPINSNSALRWLVFAFAFIGLGFAGVLYIKEQNGVNL